LANGLTFCAAIAGILVVRVAGEARYDRVEPLPSRGEIDNGGEYRGIVVEKELHPLQRSQYCVLEESHMSVRSGCVTRGMRAATVRVCAVAEWDEAVIWRRIHVAVRMLRLGGGGRASSGSVINMVGME